jgi:hypothetical protein
MSLPNLVPRADLTGSLGTSNKRWKEVHAQTIYGDGSNITGVSSNIKTSATDTTGSLYLEDALSSSNTITISKSISGGDETLVVKIQDALFNSFIYGQSTGLYEGGVITSTGTGASTFNVSAGRGQIADNFTDINNPTVTQIRWDAIVSASLPDIATEEGTYVFISGSILELGAGSGSIYTLGLSEEVQDDKRDYIFLGVIGHPNNTSIQNIFNTPTSVLNPANQLEDLASSIGPFAIEGNSISFNGANQRLDKSAGKSFFFNSTTVSTPKNPHVLVNAATTAGAIGSVTQNNTFAPGTQGGVAANECPTTLYDAGGAPVNIPGTTSWVTPRIWYAPILNVLVYQYSQYTYASEIEALSGFDKETFGLPGVLPKGAYIVAVLVHQDGATNFQNNATLIPQGKFSGTGTGAGVSVSTLQNAYNNSTTPEILTDDTRQAVTIYGENATSRSIEFGVSGSGGPTINAWINHAGTGSFTQVTAISFEGDGSGLTGVTASAAPTGPTTSVQFNDGGGATSGSSDFTFDKVTGGVTANSFTGSLEGTASVAISSSYSSVSGDVDYTNISNKPTLVSGSSQIDYNNLTNLPSGILSSSNQIATEVSGAFTQDSSSFSTRVTSNETNITNLQTDSGSFSTRVTAVETDVTSLTSKTGSYATTGSNTFVGNQNVTGTVTATSLSGSFSGSYEGDGSGLTGVTATAAPGGSDTDIQFNNASTTSGSNNLQYDYTNNVFKVNAGQSSRTTRVTTSTYTVLPSDYRIGIAYSLTGSANIQLPLISDVPGQEFRFKDEQGKARVNKQHILASGSDVIDGAPTASMKNSYEAFLLYNDGISKWFVE